MVRRPIMSAWIRHLARCARNSLSPSISSRLLMRWLSLSTNTRMGPSPSCSMASRTRRDKRIASSTPTAVRSATPITTALPPFRNGPDPNSKPRSLATSWPCGNREARMSSSVIAGLPDLVGQGAKLFGRHGRNGVGVGDAFGLPDVHGVGAGTKTFQPILQTTLLGLQNFRVETGRGADQTECRIAKTLYRIVGKGIRAAKEPPVLAAHRAPHQRAILGIEFLDAAIGLDDLRT